MTSIHEQTISGEPSDMERAPSILQRGRPLSLLLNVGLTGKQIEMLQLRFGRGLEPTEIAPIQAVPATTVRVRMHRLLGKLRESGQEDQIVEAAKSEEVRRLVRRAELMGVIRDEDGEGLFQLAGEDKDAKKQRLLALARYLGQYYGKRDRGELGKRDEAEMEDIHEERALVMIDLLEERLEGRAPEIEVRIYSGVAERLHPFSQNKMQLRYPNPEDPMIPRVETIFLSEVGKAGIPGQDIMSIIGEYAVVPDPTPDFFLRTHAELKKIDEAIREASGDQAKIAWLHELQARIVTDRYLLPWTEGRFDRPPLRIRVGSIQANDGNKVYKVSVGETTIHSVTLLPLSSYEEQLRERMQWLINKRGPQYTEYI